MAAPSCTTPGCTNDVLKPLACPECLKYGVRNVFCNQACFRASYKEHKKIHSVLKQMGGGGNSSAHGKTPPKDGIVCSLDSSNEIKQSLPIWANNYNFTGTLRPALLSPNAKLQILKLRNQIMQIIPVVYQNQNNMIGHQTIPSASMDPMSWKANVIYDMHVQWVVRC